MYIQIFLGCCRVLETSSRKRKQRKVDLLGRATLDWKVLSFNLSVSVDQEFLNEADLDGDGIVNYEEFVTMIFKEIIIIIILILYDMINCRNLRNKKRARQSTVGPTQLPWEKMSSDVSQCEEVPASPYSLVCGIEIFISGIQSYDTREQFYLKSSYSYSKKSSPFF